MEDLLDQSNEVQDALSRCYDIGDVVDEDDLEAGILSAVAWVLLQCKLQLMISQS